MHAKLLSGAKRVHSGLGERWAAARPHTWFQELLQWSLAVDGWRIRGRGQHKGTSRKWAGPGDEAFLGPCSGQELGKQIVYKAARQSRMAAASVWDRPTAGTQAWQS